MNDAQIEEAAARIRAGMMAGRLANPPAIASKEQGLAIQLAVLRSAIGDGDAAGGWKVGLTSGGGRDRMGAGYRPFGFVLESRIFSAGSQIVLPPRVSIEAELAFLVGRPLYGPDLTDAEIRDAVVAVMPAFELAQQRLTDSRDDGLALANGLAQWGMVLGAPRPWRGRAAEVALRLYRDDHLVADVAPGFEIDETVDALRSICARLAEFGLGLQPGQRVLTGAYAVLPVDEPSSWRAEFRGTDSIGEVSVQLTSSRPPGR